jgi:hypothetical protein
MSPVYLAGRELLPGAALEFEQAGPKPAGHNPLCAMIFQLVTLEKLGRPSPVLDRCGLRAVVG